MPEYVAATRVQIICPCGKPALAWAANAMVTVLLAEPTIREWGGITHSSIEAPIFRGFFWDSDLPAQNQEWEPDDNILIFIDAWGEKVSGLVSYLEALRTRMNQVHAEVGEAQKQVWITTHPLLILM